jgi:hypothetical protein
MIDRDLEIPGGWKRGGEKRREERRRRRSIYSLGLLRVALLRVALRRVDALLLLLRVAALLIVFLAGHCLKL